MNSSSFLQGFLCVFGLSPFPFQKDIQAKEKIGEYWQKAAAHFANIFCSELPNKSK